MRGWPGVAVLALLASSCAGSPPELERLDPAAVAAGGSVTLEGSGFGLATGAWVVRLASDDEPPLDVSGGVTAWGPSRATFVVPRALSPARYSVHVEVDGLRSNDLSLLVTPAPRPVVSALVPPRAEPGGLMTIRGSGFGPDEGRVLFAPDVVASTSSWSDGEIIVTTPDAPEADGVRVETAEGFVGEWFALAAPEPEPRLSVIQETIFAPTCAWDGCHGAMPAVGLSLLEGDSWTSLVGAASTHRPDVLRVDPFSPETSFLLDKLTHDPPSVGERMPLGLPPLADESIALIEAWIWAGAPNN